MPTISTLIVDDETEARRGLRALLHEDGDIDVVAECRDGREAVDAILLHRPQLVFLDVQMPRLDGFEVVRSVQETCLPLVIFTTAYDRYALQAFDVHAVDYLLKPFSNRRFRQALQQAKEQVQHEQALDALNERLRHLIERLDRPPRRAASPQTHLRRLAVKQQERVTFVDVEDIDWIEAADNYVCLHVGEHSHLVRATLSQMEEALDPERFLRIHRSRIVNVDRIREMHPLGSGDCLLVLDDGTELTSSRTYGDRRREVLDPLSG